MEPVIDRQDLITDSAFKAPLDLKNNFKSLEMGVDQFIETLLKEQKVMSDTTSVDELTKSLNKLLLEQNKLIEMDKKLEKEIKDLREENKKLTQEQSKLEKQLHDTKKKVEEQGQAMDALDNRLGGNIMRWKQLGRELWAIAKHPIVLILAAIVALLAAATSAVKTFYTTTGEGEDDLDRQAGAWSQFFALLKDGWVNLGKDLTSVFPSMEKILVNFVSRIVDVTSIIFPAWSSALKAGLDEFKKLMAERMALVEEMDKLQDRVAENIVTSAQTEKEANEALVKSKEKDIYTDQQRLGFLQEFARLKKEQLEVDKDIAKTKAELVLAEIGLDHNLSAEKVKSMTLEQMRAKFTGEEMIKIREAQAAVIKLEAAYAAEVKKNTAAIIALKEEIRKEAVEKAMEEVEAKVKAGELELEAKIQLVRDEVMKEGLLKKEGDKKIEQLRRANAANLIDLQMKALEQILHLEILSAEERAKIEKMLVELKLKYNEALYNGIAELEEVTVESGISKIESLRNITESFANSVGEVFTAAHETRMNEIDDEEKRLEDFYDRQIEMAGDNTKKKSKLENEFARRQRALEIERMKELRRAAIFEKAVTFIQAGANAALAATNQAAKGDPYSAFARVAAILAALAPLVASIATKQIPAFKGGGTTQDEIVRVSEEGPEHFVTPSGKTGYTPLTESIVKFPIGTKITAHKPSMKKLAEDALRYSQYTDRKDYSYEVLLNKFIESNKSLERTIRNKRETHYNWTKQGLEKAFINGNTRRYFLDNMYP